MKTTTLLKTVFFFVIVVLMVLAFFTFQAFTQYKNDARWVKHTNLVKFKLEYILSQLKDLETAQRGYAITSDASFLEPMAGKKDAIQNQLTELDSLTEYNPNQQSNVVMLRKLISGQFKLIDMLMSNQDKLDLSKSNLISQYAEAKSNMDEIRLLIDNMEKEENSILEERSTQITEMSIYVPVFLVSFAIVSLGALLYLYYYLSIAFIKVQKAEKAASLYIEKLHTEAGIRKVTEKLLKGVLNSSRNGIMAFEAVRNKSNQIIDFRWQLVNNTAEQMTGKKKEELINQRLLDIMPGNKTSGLFDRYREVVETGKSLGIEQYYAHDGIEAWFFISGIKLMDGIVVTFNDITRQKLQNLLIAENAALLSEAEKLAETGSWEWNMISGKITWSANVYKIYGLQENEIIPTFDTFVRYLHPEDKKEIMLTINDSAQKHQPYSIGYRIIVNNEIKYIQTNAKPRHDEHGEFTGYLGVIQDVSLRHEYEQLLIKQTQELQKSNQELEQFAYIASHDLQEPLRKIRSFGDRLITKYKEQLGDTGKDYIQRMTKASKRMQTLIEDLLKFSRISRNMEGFDLVNLSDVLSLVLSDMQESIKTSNATIRYEDLPVINGNETQLWQLFQNIISNAIKFQKEGIPPEIDISTRKVSGKSLKFENADPTLKYFEISIKDNGIGFDDKYLHKIFSVFQRLHGRHEYDGTGIGLAICEKVVSNHFGYITAHGQKGEGAEFKIYFPSISKYNKREKRQNAKTRDNYHFNG